MPPILPSSHHFAKLMFLSACTTVDHVYQFHVYLILLLFLFLEIILKPVTVRIILSKHVLPGNIILHKQLQKQLGSGEISWFRITYSNHKPKTIQGLILHPIAEGQKVGLNLQSYSLIKAKWLSDNWPL